MLYLSLSNRHPWPPSILIVGWWCSITEIYLIFAHYHKLECPTFAPLVGWRFTIKRTNIAGNLRSVLIEYIGFQKLSNYLHNRNRLSRIAFSITYWKSVGDILRRPPIYFILGVVKHIRRFCGTGVIMKTVGSWHNNHWTCFQYEQETTCHLALTTPVHGVQILKGGVNIE